MTTILPEGDIANSLGGGIYTVNLLCGFFFSIGLMVFCKSLPRPMLAVVAAIPYMTVVLAMGYSRQATALGFGMLALNAIIYKSTFRFSIWIIVAALFHKSAVLLIPVAALISSKSRILTTLWIVIAAIGAYVIRVIA
ncbi:EpsG family protein [Vibrio diabolicus]|uniref:EpsG family protein n=1 Tax=Vibrio diabolicus TaxID=50719 RepID=UPI002495772F|nr:EpsG family protein [Vibrio diabolicus]